MFIRRLIIERYRGIEYLKWDPPGRINCLIGPGDAGKSTILSAIEHLLDPTASPNASEFDYFRRRVERGYEITAVLGDLDEEFKSSFRVPPLQGWLRGELKDLSDEDGAEAVLVARVSGSAELDVSHNLVTRGEAENLSFSQSARRRLLLSRITTGARANTELRLGRGSLLDRHVKGSDFQAQLRATAAAALADVKLPEDASKALAELQTLFRDWGLPDSLSLGLISPQGWSLLRLLGLVEGTNPGEAIPLGFAGAGTRQLTMFRLASALMGACPIVTVDEPEHGLEPYRQRRLIANIREAVDDRGQAFLTTHSPAILEALNVKEISRLERGGNPVVLEGDRIARVQRRAPDALLSRLPILCEGDTEAGLLSPVLNRFASHDGKGSIDARGIRLVAGEGQPPILDEADELLGAGISIGLFVDNEDKHSGRRRGLAANERCAYGSWRDVTNIEEAVAMWVRWEVLPAVVDLAAELGGRRRESLLKQVGEAIGKPGSASLEDLRKSYSEEDIRRALAQAMVSKDNAWFKTYERGRALGYWLLDSGMPDKMEHTFRDFWKRVLEISG